MLEVELWVEIGKISCKELMCMFSQFTEYIRKLQEISNTVSVVSFLVPVKHPVVIEQQCFSKPSSVLETCSVYISIHQNFS